MLHTRFKAVLSVVEIGSLGEPNPKSYRDTASNRKTYFGQYWVAPTPYRKRKSSKLSYRQPAYLLTTDLNSSVKQLLQIYFDRWQIEVNHYDEKNTLGVGQAQLWNVTSVPKQPVLSVAPIVPCY
jgi:hypothetical protein